MPLQALPAKALLAKGYVLAGLLSCGAPPPAEVSLNFINNPATISAKSEEELRALRQQSGSPGYGGEFPVVEGLHVGTYQLADTLDFADQGMPLRGTCVRATRLEITLTYTPAIYISSNHQPGSCRYNTTLEHERRHVSTDVATLQEYIPEIKKMATLALAAAEDNRPVSGSPDDAHNRILAAVSDALDKSSTAMQTVRAIRQQAVDSREEYERLSGLCLNEAP